MAGRAVAQGRSDPVRVLSEGGEFRRVADVGAPLAGRSHQDGFEPALGAIPCERFRAQAACVEQIDRIQDEVFFGRGQSHTGENPRHVRSGVANFLGQSETPEYFQRTEIQIPGSRIPGNLTTAFDE